MHAWQPRCGCPGGVHGSLAPCAAAVTTTSGPGCMHQCGAKFLLHACTRPQRAPLLRLWIPPVAPCTPSGTTIPGGGGGGACTSKCVRYLTCTSSPAPSSASLPAVADLGSTPNRHPDRNICIVLDDMMLGTRSLELELRSPAPASREHGLISIIDILNLVAAGPVLPSLRRVLRLLGPCLPYLVRTGYIGRRFA